MDKNVLNKYKKPEDKLLLSKILDKIKFCETKNKLQITDFLDLARTRFSRKIFKTNKL